MPTPPATNCIFSFNDRHILCPKPSTLDVNLLMHIRLVRLGSGKLKQMCTFHFFAQTAKHEILELFHLSFESSPRFTFFVCLPHFGCEHGNFSIEVTPSSWAGLGPDSHLTISTDYKPTPPPSSPIQSTSHNHSSVPVPIPLDDRSDPDSKADQRDVVVKADQNVISKLPPPHLTMQPQHLEPKNTPAYNAGPHQMSKKSLPAHPRSLIDKPRRESEQTREHVIDPVQSPLSPLEEKYHVSSTVPCKSLAHFHSLSLSVCAV